MLGFHYPWVQNTLPVFFFFSGSNLELKEIRLPDPSAWSAASFQLLDWGEKQSL